MVVAFGVVCHAQMPRPGVSEVKSCETELANCRALLDRAGVEEANGVVQLAAVTPSTKSRGARSHSPAAGWHLRAWAACSQTARAVQGQVRPSSRTPATRSCRPTGCSIRRRPQPAAQQGCGSAERTAVRAGGRVSPLIRASHVRTHMSNLILSTHTQRWIPLDVGVSCVCWCMRVSWCACGCGS